MADSGAAWAEASTGAHTAWQILAWVLSIAATLGIITGALFLMPAVTAFVGSFFVDEIADEVERTHYPAEPPGRRCRCSPR
jgi:CysZ protein